MDAATDDNKKIIRVRLLLLVYGSVIHFDVNTSLHQRVHIRALKSIQISRTDFDCTIASHQLMSKVYAYFRNRIISGQNQSAKKVVSSVTPRLKTFLWRRNLRSVDNMYLNNFLFRAYKLTRNLGASYNYGFPQVFQHKR